MRTASFHCVFEGEMRNAFGNFSGSIRLSITQGWIFGIFARVMIGVMASDSPELVGPQIACTLAG